ncbi:dihydrofolate reductase family protein, partial [Clostridium saudiense]|nr:dihydrofolate reductase family protein [Clostridium saudiense]
MSRKIVLNLAISLDGYIASEDGSFEWIVGDG